MPRKTAGHFITKMESMKQLFFLLVIFVTFNNDGMHRPRKRSIHRPASYWLSPNERLQKFLSDAFSGQTIGMRAVAEIISLIREGANVNTVSIQGSTALMLACSNKLTINVLKRKNLITSLLWSGAQINQLNVADESAIAHAVRADDYETIAILLKNGATPNIQHRMTGWTPLMHAIEKRDGEEWIMLQLLKYGAVISMQNVGGATALHQAVMANKQQKTKLLLENNADPDKQDELVNSALMIAGTQEYFSMSCLLLSYGADPTLKNNAGQSFVDLVKDKPSMNALLSLRKIP